jgi:hypothetical protein
MPFLNPKHPNQNPPDKFNKAYDFLKKHPEGLLGADIADHAGLYFDHFKRQLQKKGIPIFSKAVSMRSKGAKKVYSLSETFS